MVDFLVPYTIHVQSGPRGRAWVEWKHDELHFTDRDLAWALFVTGRATGQEFKHGMWLGLWEFASRYGSVRAYVENWGPKAHLYRTPLAGFLDPTEKGNLSYALGQALAGLFCQDVLAIERLLHIDFYGKQRDANGNRRVILDKSGKRPDLFGYGSGFRVIAEAKGRARASKRDRDELAEKMYYQLRAVREIDGSSTSVDWMIGFLMVTSEDSPAHLHVFIFPSGPLFRRTARSQVVQDLYTYHAGLDPGYHQLDYSRVDHEALLISNHQSAAPYYQRFARTFETLSANQFTEGGLLKVRLPAIGVTVGVSTEMIELVSRFSSQLDGISQVELAGFAGQIDAAILRARSNNDDVLQDGSFFETTWPEDTDEIISRP